MQQVDLVADVPSIARGGSRVTPEKYLSEGGIDGR